MELPSRFAACAFSIAIVALAGCSSISYSIHMVPTSQAQYRAYGDSVTFGTFLADPQTQAYPALVAVDEGVSFANNAIPGDQGCDVATSQIFPNLDSPTLASHPTYTVLIGANDLSEDNAYSYLQVFTVCHQAVITWLAVPAEYKSLANGKDVKTSGPGKLDASNNWNAWTTQKQGSTVSFTLATARIGPIYIWVRIGDNSDATYNYSLDGDVMGSGAARTDPKINTRNHGDNSIALIRLDKVPAGKHVVTFTQTNSGDDGVSVLGIGAPNGTPAGQFPVVLAGAIPNEKKGGRCSATDKLCLAYRQTIQNDVQLFASDGLDVRYFDDTKYMLGNPDEMSDIVHPNALGDQHIAESVEAVW